ncbi:MAG: enoyl-CoA hydratase/isomerase family protein [Myxococcales bacterium]
MIEWSEREGVLELALGHEPLNEIGTAVLAGLEEFLQVARERAPRAVLIHSTLQRGFCAGADLRELHAAVAGRPYAEYRQDLSGFLDRIHAVMDGLDTLPCTTVGAVHGVCFGGGFELALALDVIVADPGARFCFPELRLGIIPGFGGIPRLKRELPNALVRDLLLTGRSIGAKRAGVLGLVAHVVGRGQALEVARDLARQAARFDPEVQNTAKSFIKPLPADELQEEKLRFLTLFENPRVVEALGAFVASEDPMPYLPPTGGQA